MSITTGWLIVMSAVLGTVVIGAALLLTARSRFKKANISMEVLDFFTRLIRGRGFIELGPEALHRRLEQTNWSGLLVDLREPKNFQEGHIDGVIHRPFDDFLREVVAEGQFGEFKDKEAVLICDTGHMSRVVGEILGVDLGFQSVFSLKGGMKRWWKWNAARTSPRYSRCCPVGSLRRCCPIGA